MHTEKERYTMTQQISGSEWQEKVLDASEPVLVDFFAEWCGPCKTMAPVIEEVANEKAGSVSVYKIDIDEEEDITKQYRVMSIPTLIVFKNGEPAARKTGIQQKEDLLAMLD